MAGDLSEWIATLPPWGQSVANIVTLAVVSALGIREALKARKVEREREPEPEPFDAEELLEASPVRRFLEAVDEIAANAKLQSEALRNISAVATLHGKVLETDYDELRVFKAVQEALERRDRQRQGAQGGGWGGP